MSAGFPEINYIRHLKHKLYAVSTTWPMIFMKDEAYLQEKEIPGVLRHFELQNKSIMEQQESAFHTNAIEDQQKILAQQKAYKQAKDHFKSEIKKQVELQIECRKSRSPKYKNGSGFIATAQMTHALNRYDLRHMYLAYAIIRAKHGGYTKLGGTAGLRDTTTWQAILDERIVYDNINIKRIKELIKKYEPKQIVYPGTK